MSMQGKVVVITGATSGVGQVAAERLAAAGGRIVLVARDRVRAEDALLRLTKAGPDQHHTAYFAELSSLSDVQRVASNIAAAEPRIDVLINNAGAMMGSQRETTADGLERTFATNHMAHVVLTDGLIGRISASTPVRIINTASDRAMVTELAFDDLQGARKYTAMDAYCKSKLCNLYFTRALAKRLAGTGVTANAWNPGFMNTRFFETKPFALRVISKLIGGNPNVRAETLVHLASARERATNNGTFWAYMKPGRMSAASQEDASAERLWEASMDIAERILGEPLALSKLTANQTRPLRVPT